MSRRVTISQSEAASLVELLAEAGEARADPSGRMEHVLAGLLRVVGARFAVATLWKPFEPWNPVTPRVVASAGPLDNSEQDAVVRYFESRRLTADPALAAFCRLIDLESLRAATFGRESLVSDRQWYSAEHVQDVRREARLDPCIYSLFALDDEETQLSGCLTVHRAWQDRPFSAREISLAGTLHAGLGPIFTSFAANGECVSLPPHLRAVLHRLLAGESEKEAARALGLTYASLHTCVKRLYRMLGVSSRGELMARFVRPRSDLQPAPEDCAG